MSRPKAGNHGGCPYILRRYEPQVTADDKPHLLCSSHQRDRILEHTVQPYDTSRWRSWQICWASVSNALARNVSRLDSAPVIDVTSDLSTGRGTVSGRNWLNCCVRRGISSGLLAPGEGSQEKGPLTGRELGLSADQQCVAWFNCESASPPAWAARNGPETPTG